METQNDYIAVTNLYKQYTNQNQQKISVIDGVSFHIAKGEFICIVGGSGCGKTTLLRILAGLDTEYEGEVLVKGELVLGPSKNRGFVYQENRLFPWFTVWDNIRFVINEGTKEEQDEKIQKVIEMVGMEGFENAYPKELSGGMAQRVNIARALVNNPSVLLLDEPFGALDAFTKMQLQDRLLKIKHKRNSTMVFVTHDIEEAVYLADRIFILSDRPTSISSIVNIDLRLPRDRGGMDFVDYRKQIYKYFNYE